MHIYIPGHDARMQLLKEEALARGHTLADALHCDMGILPLPDSRTATAQVSGVDGHGRTLLHGRLEAAQAEALHQQGWQLKNIQEDADYVQKNAFISAEGALFAAMQRVDFTLRGAQCAVVGFGRIGRELTRLLLALGAEVRVAARRETSREQAVSAGAKAYDTAHLHNALNKAQILFNTVPVQVIDSQALATLAPGALILELASPPYGFDLQKAREMGFDAMLESGIPSRYAPRTAARLLMDYMEAGDAHG